MKKLLVLLVLLAMVAVNCSAAIYQNYFTTNANPSVGGATNGIQQVGGVGTNTTLYSLTVATAAAQWPGNSATATVSTQSYWAVSNIISGRVYLRAISNNVADSVNIIGGSPKNYIDPSVNGATIGGGGETAASPDYTNAIFSKHATISGGVGNFIGIESTAAVIGGGEWNKIAEANVFGSRFGVIAGGEVNHIGDDSPDCFLGGGYFNNIGEGSDSAAIAGGYQGWSAGDFTFIGGGFLNRITNNYAAVLGGYSNRVTAIGGQAVGNALSVNEAYSAEIGYGSASLQVRSNGQVNVRGPLRIVGAQTNTTITSAIYGSDANGKVLGAALSGLSWDGTTLTASGSAYTNNTGAAGVVVGQGIGTNLVNAATLIAGSNVTITTNTAGRVWTIASTGGSGGSATNTFYVTNSALNATWTNRFGGSWDNSGSSVLFYIDANNYFSGGIGNVSYLGGGLNLDNNAGYYVGDVGLSTAAGDFNLHNGTINALTVTTTVNSASNNVSGGISAGSITVGSSPAKITLDGSSGVGGFASTIYQTNLTASRKILTDASKGFVSAAASGAVPDNADGSASTSAQIGALFTGGSTYLKADGTTGTGGGSSITPYASGLASFYSAVGSNTFWESGDGVIVKDNFRGAVINPLTGATGASGGNATGSATGVTGQSGVEKINAYPTNTGSFGIVRQSQTAMQWQSKFIADASLALSGREGVEYSFGLLSAPSATSNQTDSIRWYINTNWSANFIAMCQSNSVANFWTSSLPVVDNQIVRLGIYAPDTNAVYFYTNGILATSITTAIPSGRSMNYGVRVLATTAGGSSTSQILYLDYHWFLFE